MRESRRVDVAYEDGALAIARMKKKTILIRSAIVLGVLGAIVAFFAFGLEHQLSLDALQAHQHDLEEYARAHPISLAAGFFLIYVAFAALSLPAATLMTAAAGALFGLLEGTLLVSFASSIGATLAFLASRYVFRDAVRRRFGKRLHAVNEGIRREGGVYLFTLRLVPAIPFFAVNMLMGLTELPVRTFYWV